MPDE
jgi:hypothetical protein